MVGRVGFHDHWRARGGGVVDDEVNFVFFEGFLLEPGHRKRKLLFRLAPPDELLKVLENVGFGFFEVSGNFGGCRVFFHEALHLVSQCVEGNFFV